MYNDLKIYYLCPGMKKDIFIFVGCYLICQQFKAEHKRLSKELQLLHLPEWKWEGITEDFVVGLPRILFFFKMGLLQTNSLR